MKLVRVYTNIVVLNEMRSRTDGPALGIEGYSVADVTSQHIGPSLQALPNRAQPYHGYRKCLKQVRCLFPIKISDEMTRLE